jgi:class 3 adenylate cyclase
MALTSALPLAALATLLLGANAESLKLASREQRVGVVEVLSERVDRAVVARERDLSGVARALTDPSLSPDARLSGALSVVATSPEVDHAGVYDAAGAIIDTIRAEGAPSPELPGALDADARAQAEADGLGVTRQLDRARVVLVLPMRARQTDQAGKLTGFVAAAMPLEPLREQLVAAAAERFGGDPDAVALVGADNVTLAHSDPARVGKPHPLGWIDADVVSHRVARSGEVARPDGGTALVSARPAERVPWAVLASERAEVAYAPLTRLRQLALGALVLALAAVALLALLFSRRLLQPVDALMRMADALARRDFSARTGVARADEIGALAAALDGSAAAIQESEARVAHERATRQDLGRFLPAELVERVVAREHALELGGERQAITVLFADVVAFTPLCERLEPERVVALLNELFTIVTEIVFSHGGTVDKFIGDCVMAFWGAPEPTEDHAARALEAAEEILAWLDAANVEWEAELGARVEIAIGVHTGEAIVGNVGSKARMTYTAIGEVVNDAARLEALARPDQILTTAATLEAAGRVDDGAPLGPRKMSDGSKALELYALGVT